MYTTWILFHSANAYKNKNKKMTVHNALKERSKQVIAYAFEKWMLQSMNIKQ